MVVVLKIMNDTFSFFHAAQACAAAPLVLLCRNLMLHLPPVYKQVVTPAQRILQLLCSITFSTRSKTTFDLSSPACIVVFISWDEQLQALNANLFFFYLR
jgi:hypothetical protein